MTHHSYARPWRPRSAGSARLPGRLVVGRNSAARTWASGGRPWRPSAASVHDRTGGRHRADPGELASVAQDEVLEASPMWQTPDQAPDRRLRRPSRGRAARGRHALRGIPATAEGICLVGLGPRRRRRYGPTRGRHDLDGPKQKLDEERLKGTLVRLIDSRDEIVRRKALEMIESRPTWSRDAVAVLVARLSDPSRLVRIRTMEVLRTLGPDARPALASIIRLLKERTFRDESLAIETLRSMGPGTAGAGAVELLTGPPRGSSACSVR